MKRAFPLQICLLLAICFQVSAQTKRTGKDYAVFFYVTKFKPNWLELKETRNDAIELQKELAENFGFICDTTANPKRADILAKLKSYNDRLGPEDQLFLFFSMHGHYDSNADRGYLIASDGEQNDEYGTTWLSYDELGTYLARCKAGHILLALDACHSGAFGIRNKSRPDKPDYGEPMDCAQRMAKVFQYSGRQFCSSGNKESKTPAKSLFANRILEALRKGVQNDMVRFDDLEYYLGKVENPTPETGTFRGHEPGGDFVFLRKNACPAESPEQKEQRDLQAWRTAKATKNYSKYISDWCPGGEFCELAAEKIKNTPPEQKASTSVKKSNRYRSSSLVQKPSIQPSQISITEDSLHLVFVKGGTFQMGCGKEQRGCANDELPTHQVTVSDFYIGKYEVTQQLWKQVMGNKTESDNCDNCPVDFVAWESVQGFLKNLNAKFPGRNFRLPTEAEWEYAARGGQLSNGYLYAGSNSLGEVAWYISNSDTICQPVGRKIANELGLFDMTGNVSEWCSDWYDKYASEGQVNPVGPDIGKFRVHRGGNANSVPPFNRISNRENRAPDSGVTFIGFRLACSK